MAEIKKLIIAMSGASGSHLALHLMQVLSAYSEVETYLMISGSRQSVHGSWKWTYRSQK